MAFKLLILLLPALALARIEVELSNSYHEDQPHMNVYFSGSENTIITDEERKTFQLTEENLKNGVKTYFGAYPDDVYLHSLTQYGDLHKTFQWSQVLRTLAPKGARVIHVSNEPQILKEEMYENNSEEPKNFNISIWQAVPNTVKSTWRKNGDLTINQDTSYEFELEQPNGIKDSIHYTSKWGMDNEKTNIIRVGALTSLQMMLQPQQSVVVQLQAVKNLVQVEIDYEARLSGDVAANFKDQYKGHQFWALDVNKVMSSSDLPKKYQSTEVIDIVYYTNAKVVVQDKFSGLNLMEVAF